MPSFLSQKGRAVKITKANPWGDRTLSIGAIAPPVQNHPAP
ncbi:MAG: hypothetical protein VKJ46_04445 [Leptolyngbyaceae bacterium]|nr:hypothetical protein [Leptolyngbyaceae bacterium]